MRMVPFALHEEATETASRAHPVRIGRGGDPVAQPDQRPKGGLARALGSRDCKLAPSSSREDECDPDRPGDR